MPPKKVQDHPIKLQAYQPGKGHPRAPPGGHRAPAPTASTIMDFLQAVQRQDAEGTRTG